MAPDLHNDPHLRTAPNIAGFKVLPPAVLYAKVGEGGMGCVYRGRHVNLDVDVAVKCLNPSLAGDGRGFVVRFQREARLAASIHHQNLVQVFDASSTNGVHYLVMEFVQGETARQRIRRKGRLPVMESALITLGAARGLAEAHARGIVHRDIKPDNIMVSHTGCVKVSDLGLAKLMDDEGEHLTRTLSTMGTPQYMAPEQWRDASSVGPAADVWALGATFYFLLAGDNPCAGTTMEECCRKICQDPFPDIGTVRDDVPDEVKKILSNATARDPAERYPTAAELARALEAFVGNQPGIIADNADSSDEITASMVSPPPPQTLAQIRLDLESKYDIPKGIGDVSDPNIAKAPAAPVEEPPKRSLRKVWMSAAAVLLALLVGWIVVERVRVIHARPALAWKVDAPFDVSAIHWTNQNPIEVGGLIENSMGGEHVVVARDNAPRDAKPLFETDADDKGRWKLVLPLSKGEEATFVVRTDDIDNALTLRAHYDTDPPQITITSPANDAYFGKSTLEVRAKIQDDAPADGPKVLVGAVPFVMKRDGQDWVGQVELRDGSNELAVQGVDLAGNPGKSDSVHVVLDTTPPVPSLRPAAGQALTGGEEQEFTVSFDEEVKNVKVRTAGAGEQPVQRALGGGGWSGISKIAVPPYEKQFRLTVEAQDLAGNTVTPNDGKFDYQVNIVGKPPSPDFELAGDDKSAAPGTQWAQRIRHRKTGIELVLVRGGTFSFGAKQPHTEAGELLARDVEVSGPFWIGVTEVTAGQLALGLDVPVSDKDKSDFPAVSFTRTELERFCKTNHFRLPSETEWEYAACWHDWDPTRDVDLRLVANIKFDDGKSSGLMAVRSHAPNTLGLYDVIGNALELTNADYDQVGNALDPTKVASGQGGSDLVSFALTGRGGTCNTYWRLAGLKNRKWWGNSFPPGSSGFRVVIKPPDESAPVPNPAPNDGH